MLSITNGTDLSCIQKCRNQFLNAFNLQLGRFRDRMINPKSLLNDRLAAAVKYKTYFLVAKVFFYSHDKLS